MWLVTCVSRVEFKFRIQWPRCWFPKRTSKSKQPKVNHCVCPDQSYLWVCNSTQSISASLLFTVGAMVQVCLPVQLIRGPAECSRGQPPTAADRHGGQGHGAAACGPGVDPHSGSCHSQPSHSVLRCTVSAELRLSGRLGRMASCWGECWGLCIPPGNSRPVDAY